MSKESIYWIIVLITFVIFLIKFRKYPFLILILLFFFEGLFTYYGQYTWNIYKIFIPVFALLIVLQKKKEIKLTGKSKWLIYTFAIFSLFYVVSSLINRDYLLLFLNQYSRYLLPFLSYLLIMAYSNQGWDFNSFNIFIKKILSIQIFLSFVNFLLMGIHENIVGSVSSNGGSAATTIPLLGIIFIWFKNKGTLKRNDWIYIFFLIFIGFVSAKRAIWILSPIFLMLLIYYIPHKKINRNIFIILPLLPLILYFGIRLSPSFNKEGKLWGSFDLNYFYNFSMQYTFGDNSDDDVRVGRGGATFLTIESIFSKEKKITFFGNGLLNMYSFGDDSRVENPDSPILISDINSITMATGLFQNYYTGGIIGVLSFLAFMSALFFTVKNKRIRNVLILAFLWEYLFYANNLIRTPASSFLLIYLIIYSNEFINFRNGSAKVVNSLS